MPLECTKFLMSATSFLASKKNIRWPGKVHPTLIKWTEWAQLRLEWRTIIKFNAASLDPRTMLHQKNKPSRYHGVSLDRYASKSFANKTSPNFHIWARHWIEQKVKSQRENKCCFFKEQSTGRAKETFAKITPIIHWTIIFERYASTQREETFDIAVGFRCIECPWLADFHIADNWQIWSEWWNELITFTFCYLALF